MVAGCQDLIVQGIDALIVSPVKPPAIGPVVEAAHEAGIPIIIDDIGGGGSNYDAIVISDNFGGGAMAGEYVIEELKSSSGSKEVAIIKVEPSAVYAIRRGEGFKDAVTKAGNSVVTELSGLSKPEEGYSIMQDIIVAHPDVQAVFAENDPMAAAAAQAAVKVSIPLASKAPTIPAKVSPIPPFVMYGEPVLFKATCFPLQITSI